MRDYKFYIASGIFVIATILKLLMPEATEAVRTRVVTAIDTDMDYQAVLTQLGTIMTDENVQEVVNLFRDEDETQGEKVLYRPEVGTDLLAETVSILPEDWDTTTVTPTPEPTPTPDSVPESVRQAVDAFLESQAEFSDYTLPETVSYEYLEIPFLYTAPVTGTTSSGFGYRLHPVENVVKFHYGTDYAVNTGTDILSFANGTVTECGWDDGYGNYIRISHEGGWSTLYAHCSQTYVQAGQTVTIGEKIALAGDTGNVTGPHLHFELLHSGLYTNPEFFF